MDARHGVVDDAFDPSASCSFSGGLPVTFSLMYYSNRTEAPLFVRNQAASRVEEHVFDSTRHAVRGVDLSGDRATSVTSVTTVTT